MPKAGKMDWCADVAAFEFFAIEIDKVTPREARKVKTEAEYNDDKGSIVTESEGTL